MKNVTRIVLGAVTGAYLAIAGSVIAGHDQDVKVIKVLKEDDMVSVNLGDGVTTEIPEDVLSDKEALRSYLGELDEKTMALLLDLLSGLEDKEGQHKILKLSKYLEKAHGEHRKVIVLDDEPLSLNGVDMETIVNVAPEIHLKKLKSHHGDMIKHVVVDVDEGQAHQKAIISLLENGEYTQEQLEEIQQALDSKR